MSDNDVIENIKIKIKQEEIFEDADIDECEKILEKNYRDISFDPNKVRLNRNIVENFKIIEYKDIEFTEDFNMIFGENRSGKTSFLDSILFNLLGIPESSRKRNDYEMTNLIHNGTKSLSTEGYWQIDESEYIIERYLETRGQGGKYSRYDEPRILEDAEDKGIQKDVRHSQSEVSELIGIKPLVDRGFNRFGIFSLFFLTNKNFRRFLDWSDKSDLIDLFFGLNLTNVINAIESKIEEEYKISEEIEEAPNKIFQKKDELEKLKEELKGLKADSDKVQANLSDKREHLNSINDVLEGENKLNKLESRLSDLKNKRIDLKKERDEIQEEIRKTENAINRYEDTDLKQDLEVIADEIRDLMTVPDRCPVCTNDIDSDQRMRLIDEGFCPLCDKEMPQERINVEKEYQSKRSITEVQREHRKELSDLKSKKGELNNKLNILKKRIEDVEEEINEVEREIESTDLKDYVNKREKLQREVRDLKEESVDIEVKIEAKSNRIESLKGDIEELKELEEKFQKYAHKRRVLKTFKRIVKQVRDDQRSSVKNSLSILMEDMLDYFSEGIFSDATSVNFSSGSKYNFEIYTEHGEELKSSNSNESTAEIILHALLFHTSILKHISEKNDSLPIRIFVIDAPFSNETDTDNADDIEKFLRELPEILSQYQIILSTADSDSIDIDSFKPNYSIEKF